MNNSSLNIQSNNKESSNSKNNENSNQEKKKFENNLFSQAAITIFFSSASTIIFLLIKMITDQDIPKYFVPLLAFPLNFFIISKIYPKRFTRSFGTITAYELRRKIGFYISENLGKNILLGFVLALCTLSGLLIGSFLSGEFWFNINSFTIEQFLFATVPGVWEEVFYRGCLMIILIRWFKNIKKAIIVQSIVFGLAHLSGFGLWEIIDTIFVTILGFLFTYSAKKTNSLVPGIIFHFIHDAFIFVVQPPFDQPLSTMANISIFGFFLIMILVGFIIIKYATDNGNFKSLTLLYDISKIEN